MLVYGDAAQPRDVEGALAELAGAARLSDVDPEALLLHAAELAQGLIDHDFAAIGRDRGSPLRAMADRLVSAAALALAGKASPESVAAACVPPDGLRLPAEVSCRRPEGYAFYALYPEAYLAAAAELDGPVVAIGIRSIGLGLAALVAAATGADALFSVRPVGHPFDRRLALAPAYRAQILEHAASATFAICDEGPGLSGSSMAAVIALLREAGVPPARIHLFPGHAGEPGGAADSRVRALWAGLPRHVVPFERLFLEPDAPTPLEMLFADQVGASIEPLQEISGGAWRALTPGREQVPVNPQQERRKFLLTTEKGRFLLKFAGLGRYGAEAFERGQRLSAQGLVPAVVAFRRGFILERWVDAQPLSAAGLPRQDLLDHLARYLARRTIELPAAEGTGATLEELAAMIRTNALEAFGPTVRAAVDRICREAPQHGGRRLMTDNRLHAWEWLVTADGRLLKADALDHCAAHDLVGCQELAWDLAGAAIEFDLTPGEAAAVAQRVAAATGETVGPLRAAFFRAAYLAFQLGYYRMAADTLPNASLDRDLLVAQADRYAQALSALLGPP